MNNPKDLKYTKSDEWIRVDGNVGTVGITDYAQEQLSDVVYVEVTAGIGETVRGFAAEAAQASGGKTLEFLTVLNQSISRDFTYVTRDMGAPRPPEVTLAAREGSCRDFAVLFAAACRAAGLAARFVSGYNAGAERPEADMHAWAEVYIEGGGWRGYDPSSGLAVSTGHVAVAAAAEPALAAPVTGTFRGPAQARLTYSISVQAL